MTAKLDFINNMRIQFSINCDNRIEHVWRPLKIEAMSKMGPTLESRAVWVRRIHNAVRKLNNDPDFLKNLHNSIKNRCREVLDKDGGLTSY